MIGTIISFSAINGYGFIRRDDGSCLFFHVSDCCCDADLLQAGARVIFEIKEYPRKGIMTPKAVHVQVTQFRMQ